MRKSVYNNKGNTTASESFIVKIGEIFTHTFSPSALQLKWLLCGRHTMMPTTAVKFHCTLPWKLTRRFAKWHFEYRCCGIIDISNIVIVRLLIVLQYDLLNIDFKKISWTNVLHAKSSIFIWISLLVYYFSIGKLVNSIHIWQKTSFDFDRDQLRFRFSNYCLCFTFHVRNHQIDGQSTSSSSADKLLKQTWN